MRTVIHGNSAGSIGGLALTGSTATGNLTISNSTISGNVEANPNDTRYGAGLSATYGTTIDLRSTIVSGNVLFDGSTNFPADHGLSF